MPPEASVSPFEAWAQESAPRSVGSGRKIPRKSGEKFLSRRLVRPSGPVVPLVFRPAAVRHVGDL